MTTSKQGTHVFVINDEQVLLDVVRSLLEDEGYRVSTETFGKVSIEQLLARIVAERPDVIVLDFLIGGEPLGWQLLQLLRLTPDTAKTSIVVCTAARSTVMEMGDQLGLLDVEVVFKPFDIEHLLSAVACALDRNDARKVL